MPLVALVQSVGLLFGYHLMGPALAGPALPHLLVPPAPSWAFGSVCSGKSGGSMVLILHPLVAAVKRQGDPVVWLWGLFFPELSTFRVLFSQMEKRKLFVTILSGKEKRWQ